MAIKLVATYDACIDCYFVAAGFDSVDISQECADGVDAIDNGYLQLGEQSSEFSRLCCDICRQELAGARYEVLKFEPVAGSTSKRRSDYATH